MNPVELDIMKGLISILNEANERYYNSGNPIMTDEQYDARLRDLKQLEEETNFVFSNSPTINVGAKVLTELQEVTHSHPMLSLEKCHNTDEIIKFANNKELIASIKLDGLTVSLTYENGILVKGETRGNGYVGSDITEHVKQFLNVPLKIDKKEIYIIDGEAIITDDDFVDINKHGEYKNSRNLAAGTLSVLDTSLVSKRRLKFFAWDVIDGSDSNNLRDNLNEAAYLGFDVVPHWFINNLKHDNLQSGIDFIFDYAKEEGFPCDGVVFKFNDVEYGKSLGATSHHFKNGIAYKAKDDVYETELIDIEWSCGKSGQLTPVAIFKPVEILGTIVERASLHNVSILTKLDLHIGDTIEVFKSNMIIPQIKRNISADKREALGEELDYITAPSYCPICDGTTKLIRENESTILICTNDNCKGKLLGKLTHFCSKNAMDVENLSESTIEKFIELGWLTSLEDIYYLDVNKMEMMELDGFGEKSVKKLLKAIENSKKTTLDKFLYSLSIPLVGRNVSKDIAKVCNYELSQFIMIMSLEGEHAFEGVKGIGKEIRKSLRRWWIDNKEVIYKLSSHLDFEKPKENFASNKLEGKIFCITGSLNHFINRDELQNVIENLGGKVVNSVTSKTNYLVCNEESNSSKYKRAASLGVNIINENELVNILNN